jgi:hypothetical protein
MNEIGARLRETLNRNGMSLRRAEAQLVPTGLRGINYVTLHQVIHGRSHMSVRLVEAIASVLTVNATWLAFGEGESGLPERRAADRRSVA